MRTDSMEINLQDFQEVKKQAQQGEKFISFYPGYGKVCFSKALRERLRIRNTDQVNIFYNFKKDSVAIQFVKEGAFKVNSQLAVSCSPLFNTLNNQGLRFEKKFFMQGEFNIDVVNRIIECPFK